MNAIKRHRVVLGTDAFQQLTAQRLADLQTEAAVECAENEGWPVPGGECEPLLALARAGALGSAAFLFGTHPGSGALAWPAQPGRDAAATRESRHPSPVLRGPSRARGGAAVVSTVPGSLGGRHGA